ncbi:hypothetical protein HY971_04695 [Candidatus Kaiserbacteria bacterium]|nr:hypothetical protein [Candidatus Kaiserbacteria bacterium]
MADIVDFEKFKKGPKKEGSSEARQGLTGNQIPGTDDKNFVDRLERMTRVLIGLQDSATGPSSYNETNVQSRQEGLRQYSAEELRGLIWHSNAQDWLKDPSFYTAVGRELKRKLALESEGKN